MHLYYLYEANSVSENSFRNINILPAEKYTESVMNITELYKKANNIEKLKKINQPHNNISNLNYELNTIKNKISNVDSKINWKKSLITNKNEAKSNLNLLATSLIEKGDEINCKTD